MGIIGIIMDTTGITEILMPGNGQRGLFLEPQLFKL
jgi:hypothetical protein